MCFKELAPLVHTLPEGYIDNNPNPTGKGHPVPPSPQTIGSNVLLQKPSWDQEYRGQVLKRVGPRELRDGESGFAYQVGLWGPMCNLFRSPALQGTYASERWPLHCISTYMHVSLQVKFEDGTVEDLEFDEVKAARKRFQEVYPDEAAAPKLKDVDLGDISRPSALGTCAQCEAAGGPATIVIDATRTLSLKQGNDRYGEPASLIPFCYPNGQVLQAAPLSPYSLQCCCVGDDPVLLIPLTESKQTATEKMKLIPRGPKREKNKSTGEPEGPKTGPRVQILRWSRALITWPADGKKVTAGTPIKGNEIFKKVAEYTVSALVQLALCFKHKCSVDLLVTAAPDSPFCSLLPMLKPIPFAGHAAAASTVRSPAG